MTIFTEQLCYPHTLISLLTLIIIFPIKGNKTATENMFR